MKTNDIKGAELLGKKIEETTGNKVIAKVRLDLEKEVVYYLGKTMTLLYAMKYVNPNAEKEIPKLKTLYEKHEEAAETLEKILNK